MRKPWRACTSTGSDHPAATPRIAAPHPDRSGKRRGRQCRDAFYMPGAARRSGRRPTICIPPPGGAAFQYAGVVVEAHIMPIRRHARASAKAQQGTNAVTIDINFPCPPRKVVKYIQKFCFNIQNFCLYKQKFCLFIQKFCFYFTHRDRELFSACDGSLLLTSRRLCPEERRRRAGVPWRDVQPRGRRGVAQKPVTLRQTKDLTQ